AGVGPVADCALASLPRGCLVFHQAYCSQNHMCEPSVLPGSRSVPFTVTVYADVPAGTSGQVVAFWKVSQLRRRASTPFSATMMSFSRLKRMRKLDTGEYDRTLASVVKFRAARSDF